MCLHILPASISQYCDWKCGFFISGYCRDAGASEVYLYCIISIFLECIWDCQCALNVVKNSLPCLICRTENLLTILQYPKIVILMFMESICTRVQEAHSERSLFAL